MKKLRKGDQVVVLSGKDKGRTGAITRMLTDEKVLIEGVNISKKHQRGNPQKNQPGGLLDKEMPVHVSKLAIWNAGSKKADRVGVKTLADGRRVRFLKSNNEVLDVK
ncbi:MAG: 50S ribosomal protein L24 [Steroidobacteraceae bacterium]